MTNPWLLLIIISTHIQYVRVTEEKDVNSELASYRLQKPVGRTRIDVSKREVRRGLLKIYFHLFVFDFDDLLIYFIYVYIFPFFFEFLFCSTLVL